MNDEQLKPLSKTAKDEYCDDFETYQRKCVSFINKEYLEKIWARKTN